MGASKWQVIWHVIVPAAMPEILTGMRIAIGFGWTTLVAAEMVAATEGLGQMVLNASNFLRTDVVIMGIIVIGVVAYAVRPADRGDRDLRPRRATSLAVRQPSPLARHTRDRRLLDGQRRREARVLLAQRLLQAAQRIAQLELAEHLAQPRAVGLARGHVRRVDVDRRRRACIVASCLEMRASSAWSIRFSLRLAPEISSTLASTSSSVAELLEQRRAAVLSPMPGTPGMLSEVSPFRP